MTLDLNKYKERSRLQMSSEESGSMIPSSPSSEEIKTSPVSVAMLAAVAVGAAALAMQAAPGLQGEYQNNASRQAQYAASQLIDPDSLTEDQKAQKLAVALPIWLDGGQLTLHKSPTSKLSTAGWEEIVASNYVKNGTYFTANAVIVKGLMGNNPVAGKPIVAHAVFQISPEHAANRLAQYLKETNGGF
jgi:hypothetical protein